MARPSTWLLAAALVLAAACTANAQLQARRLIQNQGPYDDVAASVQVQQVFEEAVTANVANCESLIECSPQCCCSLCEGKGAQRCS